MNPFTRFLRSLGPQQGRSDLEEFVVWWDRIEAIVVEANRQRRVGEAEREMYTRARHWFSHHYNPWATRFAPIWPTTLQGGRPAESDPFQRVIQAATADALIGDRGAMQALAAARETLNRYILQSRNAEQAAD
jgi:hypothetical protein